MYVVINKSYGGFDISAECLRYMQKRGDDSYDSIYHDKYRYDRHLIDFIHKYGSKAASTCVSNLVVENIAANTIYKILEYDGWERIETLADDDWLCAR